MIITKIYGGLGNQMFQYAIGRSLSINKNKKLYLESSSFSSYKLRNYQLDIFNINVSIINRFYLKFLLFFKLAKKVKEQEPFFKKDGEIPLGHIIFLDGYWQCEDYFKDIRKELLEDFKLKVDLDSENKKILNLIKSKNSVSLHVRRGDYVENSKTNQVHGTCSLDYYKKAIEYIKKNVKNPHFFIFSDDIDWCKENIKLRKEESFFVDINSPEKGYFDLELMKNCKHFIIANSSFSWWGAWLSENSKKIIIAPKQWLRSKDEGELVPKSWIRL